MKTMIHVTPEISIEETEIELDFIRSSGPGGQNVNKVATAVQLRFAAGSSPSLSDEVRERLVRIAGKRMSKEGILVIDARRFRTQEQNRRDALKRFFDLVQEAARKPRRRIKTRPTAASRRRRIETKLQRGETKRARQRIRGSED